MRDDLRQAWTAPDFELRRLTVAKMGRGMRFDKPSGASQQVTAATPELK
jgi:hypothetical protein